MGNFGKDLQDVGISCLGFILVVIFCGIVLPILVAIFSH
jgi:hypothetical protein